VMGLEADDGSVWCHCHRFSGDGAVSTFLFFGRQIQDAPSRASYITL
jgi:hypothetical protein